VLDIGCGAGTDLLLAARRTGPKGKAIGVDPTPAMRESAARFAREIGLAGIVEIRAGSTDALPVDDGSVDVVISNGVVNLAPYKSVAFGEIARVLKPGGRLYLADVMIQEELSEKSRRDADLWAA
jgi:arsenite methyltransferase